MGGGNGGGGGATPAPATGEAPEVEVDDEGNLIDPEEPRYCLCNRVSFGTMIQCDNVDVSFFPLSIPGFVVLFGWLGCADNRDRSASRNGSISSVLGLRTSQRARQSGIVPTAGSC
jgi:hypothetical protein